ncbi:MAG TPA: DegT/DnrJ/EryC1/StrS family aminotransferase [Patescibacteria group bacterium]|nr:DegT/DnrJ/EryC1/StrS family aminotransferase [Patescibacteria group bacterium]
MTIFNSLGSNYTFRFVLHALFTRNKKHYTNKLIEYLEKKYQGKAHLLYKARNAITVALHILRLPKNSFIAINGFTCYAVYEAIIKAGHKPYYLDIDEDLNFSARTLEQALLKNTPIRAVIIQNTLGIPCDIEKISALCKKYQCFLMEDLAHSAGTVYNNGQKAGTVGDCTILSFGMDKIIDSVSGGALIIRMKIPTYSYTLEKVPFKQQIKDRLYPLFTFLIRKSYFFLLGKIIHTILKNLCLLNTPMESLSEKSLPALPSWQCHLTYEQLTQLENNLQHRRTIATIYSEKINPFLQSKKIIGRIPQSTNLRFPAFTKRRENLIAYLRQNNVYISDIWYDDAPIQCPKAEKIAHRIINLPTHQALSEKQALHIALLINRWVTS